MSEFEKTNEKIAEGVVKGYKNIETGVVKGYKAIENGVVGGYKSRPRSAWPAKQKSESRAARR